MCTVAKRGAGGSTVTRRRRDLLGALDEWTPGADGVRYGASNHWREPRFSISTAGAVASLSLALCPRDPQPPASINARAHLPSPSSRAGHAQIAPTYCRPKTHKPPIRTDKAQACTYTNDLPRRARPKLTEAKRKPAAMAVALRRAARVLLLLLGLLSTTAHAARAGAGAVDAAELASKKPSQGPKKPAAKPPPVVPGGGGGIPNIPGFAIPGMGGFGGGIPGMAGGWGGGYGGPAGGYARGGVVAPTVTCYDKGPCYRKKVTCPKKCFSSYSGAGKGYGGGGGGGSCTVDCKVKCTAYC